MYTSNMKKLLLLALAVIAVVGAVVLSTRQYKEYQTNQQRSEKVAAQQKAEEFNTLQLRQAQLIADYNKLYIECGKGKAAYDKLTTLAKTQNPEPSCGPVLVEQGGIRAIVQ